MSEQVVVIELIMAPILIALVNRMGGKVEIPTQEIEDADRRFEIAARHNSATGLVTFEVRDT